MKIGVIREIKDKENRVALTPAGTQILKQKGHTVLVEEGAGKGSGFADNDYQSMGATLASQEDAWNSDIVLKVKEPLSSEYSYLKKQILFTFLHLAGVSRELTEVLLKNRTTAIAYETVEDVHGSLPLLAPMSAVAGNMAVSMGNYYLAKYNGGKGVQLGTIMGQRFGKVVILGFGVVGKHAASSANGMGSTVYIASRRPEKISAERRIASEIFPFLSTRENIMHHLKNADLVVGAVLLPGAKAPHLVTEEMVKSMEPGSVLVDVSIDQGGCIETSRPTTHSDPVYLKHGIIHYCVTNMPGAYPRSSTQALTAATFAYILELAENGLDALRKDTGFAKGINTHEGHITHYPIATALGMEEQYRPFSI